MPGEIEAAAARICEACAERFPADTPGWYVDPDGVELCPECADDLYASWKREGMGEEVAF